ncbi:DUF2516 family protein [Corynebacterium spheniscorum]|uniref:DUF2516 domain-containing protein n=1 Tax=Corynebacterium spheniscorum TaxID=185761 RepID=A0A1I2U316_9CORY|nr:DUF2516 family protein [Corynebacterium spheniscorum]KAA8722285.1 DUF2516 family protein [Corynebacterium spheniscorum]SFG70819.1 Protein of unknown function [Corynebacterium spheniscorum]
MLSILSYIEYGLYLLVALSGIIGAVTAFITRADAFTAADRQPGHIWGAMLIGSAGALIIGIPIVSWVGMVVIGIYWFDVRPQIKDILSGNSTW